MIVDTIFKIVANIFIWILNIFPDFTGLPVGITYAFETILPLINNIASFFPLELLLTCIAMNFVVEGLIWLWYWFIFWYRNLPGKFT